MDVHFRSENGLGKSWNLLQPKKVFKNRVDKLLSGMREGKVILALGSRGFPQLYSARHVAVWIWRGVQSSGPGS